MLSVAMQKVESSSLFEVLGDPQAEPLMKEIGGALRTIAERVLEMERGIEKGYRSDPGCISPAGGVCTGDIAAAALEGPDSRVHD